MQVLSLLRQAFGKRDIGHKSILEPPMKEKAKKDKDAAEWRRAANDRCSREQLEHAIENRASFLTDALNTREDAPEGNRPYYNREPFKLSKRETERLNEKVTQLDGTILTYARLLDAYGTFSLQTKNQFKGALVYSLIVLLLYVGQLFFLDQSFGWQTALLAVLLIAIWVTPYITWWVRESHFEGLIIQFERDIRSLGVSVDTVKLYLFLGDYHYHFEQREFKHPEEKESKDTSEMSEMTHQEKLSYFDKKTISELERDYLELKILIELVSSLSPLDSYSESRQERDAYLLKHPTVTDGFYESKGILPIFNTSNPYLDFTQYKHPYLNPLAFIPKIGVEWSNVKREWESNERRKRAAREPTDSFT